jgi:hypothetical protein
VTSAVEGWRWSSVPGGFLVHPLPAAAAALIVFNDAVLKRSAPGWWSGKLSDVGICFLLPVVLASAGEWCSAGVAALRKRPWQRPGPWLDGGAFAVAVVYFSLLELSETWGQWHAAAVSALLGGVHVPVTRDLSDLFALVFALWAWRWLGRRSRTR